MSAIQSYLTGENIAATVVMVRTGQVSKCPIILTEGDKDNRVLKAAVRGRAEVVPGNGKAETLEALTYLKDAGTDKWLIVVVDADFDRIRNIQRPDGVLLTDCHDMDCEHLRSYALVKVAQEICSAPKCTKHFRCDLKKNPDDVAEAIRKKLLELCRPLGLLRYISLRDSVPLSFKGIDHKKTLTPAKLEVDVDSMISIVLANSSGVTVTAVQLKATLITELKVARSDWQVCQGHDLCKMFVVAVRKYWGIGDISPEEIERNLRLAYESAYFWKTQLGMALDSRLKRLGAA